MTRNTMKVFPLPRRRPAAVESTIARLPLLLLLLLLSAPCLVAAGAAPPPRGSAFSVDAPEIEVSRADLLEEIGMRPEARAFQQASGLELDESQFVVEPNDAALILPSAQHDGVPLAVEEWPVRPEAPVDSYEALKGRLTEAVENVFPERMDDFAEAQRRAAAGVTGQAPILDPAAAAEQGVGQRSSIMGEIEDLLVEMSHHGLTKGAEVSVEGGARVSAKTAASTNPLNNLGENTGFWVFVGWLGTIAVFAIPSTLVYLYVRCTGHDIGGLNPLKVMCSSCARGGSPTSQYQHQHNSVSQGGNQWGIPDDGEGDGVVGNDEYFVVHPYGDGSVAAPQRVDQRQPGPLPVTNPSAGVAPYYPQYGR